MCGDGPPVLLTHGAGADHRMFTGQAAALAEAGYRAITWDMRGHGLSRPSVTEFTAARAIADMSALLEHVDAERPVLVGQSLGGNLAQTFTRLHPDSVRALVIIGSAWNAGPLTSTERRLLALASVVFRTIPYRAMRVLMVRSSATTAAAREDLERAFGSLSKREFVAAWTAAVESLSPDPEYRTPVPLCLIRGDQDRTGNIATSMPKWAAHEAVEENVIANAGHVANQDDPSAVNAVILRFLEQLQAL
ncbi:alpha/beta hydrolase [Nocardioides sp. TF02-7]|uniref:alpha/beta fold hydrolase n=1 Tax=Nocardioides sp. TF02-7 TaxID=2917724 RepID=UPI0023DAA6C2|nr:alpha/beta hydrolase [Nocardioides sp. TF02-7]